MLDQLPIKMNRMLFIFGYFLVANIQNTFSDVFVYNSGSRLIENYDDQPANFGPSFTSSGISGYVTVTTPRTACSPIAPPPNITSTKYRWIALIPRTKGNDSCDFDLKALNAQNANFSAVIIYNYDESLLTMGSHGRNIQIPATLIALSDGLSIISNYVYNSSSKNSTPEYHLKISTDEFVKFGAYLIPFISIIGVSFLSLIFFMIVKCYLQRRHARRHRLPRSALKQLQVKKFVKGDRWEVCAICLDDFEEGAKIRILPCDHAYHMKCIDPWLLNNRRQCPICKRYVFPNHDNSDEEDNHDRGATERTPLIQPSTDDGTSNPSGTREIERHAVSLLGSVASNAMTSDLQSSDTDEDDDENHGLESSRQTPSRRTTTDLVFDEQANNTKRDSDAPLLRLMSTDSHLDELDHNTTTATITTYRSTQNSPSGSFTTPRNANFFVGSSGGATDNTNLSTRSVIENESDIENDEYTERMHSVLTDAGTNEAFVPDDESTQVLRTNL